MTKQKDLTVSIMKFFAIFSVICAHCNSVSASAPFFAQTSSRFWQQIGTIGVIIFFIVSGALFHYNKYSLKGFVIKKLLNLFIPWVISGSIVYFYVYIRKPPITFLSWLYYIIGNGSYLYYLTILFICYSFFYFLKPLRHTYSLIIISVLTIVSVCLIHDKGVITPYLDIFNWIGYFSFGILLSRYKDNAIRIFSNIEKIKLMIYFVFITSLILRSILKTNITYWGTLNFVCIVFGAVSFALISKTLSNHFMFSKHLVALGDNSLFIYLWHMPVAGIVANIMNRGLFVYGVPLRPFIVLTIMIVVLHIAKKLVCKNSFVSAIIGLK